MNESRIGNKMKRLLVLLAFGLTFCSKSFTAKDALVLVSEYNSVSYSPEVLEIIKSVAEQGKVHVKFHRNWSEPEAEKTKEAIEKLGFWVILYKCKEKLALCEEDKDGFDFYISWEYSSNKTWCHQMCTSLFDEYD